MYNYYLLLLDTDECTTGTHNCTQNQQCINMPGSFVCECVSGYRMLNETCEGMKTSEYIFAY